MVAATGASSNARVPALSTEMPRRIDHLTALEYRRPAQLSGTGKVLVVGASASGVQIADELRGAGREVTISVGEHVRLPRSYRSRDIYWWLDRIGQLDERYDEVDDIERARRHASVQLVGSDDRRDVDLNALRERGVQIVGRLMAVSGATGQCSGALANLMKNADLKQARLLRRIDDFVNDHGLADEWARRQTVPPTLVGDASTELDLTAFSTVIWATGYRPTYSWLTPDALDRRGRVIHDGGVAALPGLYFIGLPFLRRRRSNLIAGLGADAADLSDHLRAFLDARAYGDHPVVTNAPARAEHDVFDRTGRAGRPKLCGAFLAQLADQRVPGGERDIVKDRRHRRDAERGVGLDRSDELHGERGVPDAMKCDHAARQRVPLLRPVARAVPEREHVGEPCTALVDVPALRRGDHWPRCGRRRSSSDSPHRARSGRP